MSDIEKKLNEQAKDIMVECYENSVPAIFIAGFDDGGTIRAAVGYHSKLIVLMGIEAYTLSRQMNCPLKNLLGAISECAKDCAKAANKKWKPSSDAGVGNGK